MTSYDKITIKMIERFFFLIKEWGYMPFVAKNEYLYSQNKQKVSIIAFLLQNMTEYIFIVQIYN